MNTEQTETENELAASEYLGTATYSPEDNKLRLYPFARLSDEEYKRAHSLGFIWAAKQKLFVAPMWTPHRAAYLNEVCGEIGDEDTSLAERASERAERFEEYGENRIVDADRAHAAVSLITDGIPLGQPILVGHHSEKRARRDADRIQNGMRKAVKMWETAKYWTDRANGAIRSAKYKERPDVRARRIRKLESELRKQTKTAEESAGFQVRWDKAGLTRDEALRIANFGCHIYHKFTLKEFPRDHDLYEGDRSLWSALDANIIDAKKAAEIAVPAYRKSVEHCAKWIAHTQNRLAYERAMLADSGGTVTDNKGPEVGGAIQCWASPGFGRGWSTIQKVNKVSVSIHRQFRPGRVFRQVMPLDKIKGVMSKAQVDAARAAGLLAEVNQDDDLGFFLRSVADNSPAETPAESADAVHAEAVAKADPAIREENMQRMKAQLKAGVQVVRADQLFPTPQWLARRMLSLAPIAPGMRLLEPSVGTGAILREMPRSMAGEIVAVEINGLLCAKLEALKHGAEIVPNLRIVNADFLKFEDPEKFDRVYMNPPFKNGIDVVHILRAVGMLKPGGVVVAICAAGPRQHAELMPIADTWEKLPDGNFAEEGTSVSTVLATFSAQ